MIATNTFSENQLLDAPSKFHRKPKGDIVDNEIMIQMIKAKNERGFNVLYDKYCGALYGVLMKIVRRNDVADDLMQDAFIKIWKNINKYDNSKGTIFTWMLNITRNLAIDYLRSTCYRNELQKINIDLIYNEKNFNNSIAVESNELEFNDFKINALQHLNPKCAEVIDMIFFFGCTHQQAAEVLNVPLGTVKTRARTGLGILRRLYKIE